MAANPFRPSFGTTPPLRAGRDQAILAFADALDAGPGTPGRATLYTGARGVGKTVMLNQAEARAKERGWVVVSETATPGLIDRLVTEELPAPPPGWTSQTLSVASLASPSPWPGRGRARQQPGQSTHPRPAHPAGGPDRPSGPKRYRAVAHRRRAPRRRPYGSARPRRRHPRLLPRRAPDRVRGAGLPATVNDLLTDKVLTFLRRADRQHLDVDVVADAADAIQTPIEEAGRHLDDALDEVVVGTGGYPCLIQLVGCWTCRSTPTALTVDLRQARDGVLA